MVSQAERVYTVEVRCVDAGLDRFPPLPRHTRTVDLSRNKVNEKFKCLNTFLRVQCVRENGFRCLSAGGVGRGGGRGGRGIYCLEREETGGEMDGPTLPSY